MFFANLTAGEFTAIFGALAAVVTALYLLDRTRRKKVVSTLQFWTSRIAAEDRAHRRRLRQPWSLALQLASLLLLLLALAQLQWGGREGRGRDHVILLDTSSWTGESSPQGTVLEREKAVAKEFLRRIPPVDRVMVVEANALAKPVSPFTSDRGAIVAAVDSAAPKLSALNIQQAIAFAQHAQTWSGGQPGDILYAGPELVDSRATATPEVANLRTILVPASRENAGIRGIAVRHSERDPNGWQASVTLQNYGSQPRAIRLLAGFAGSAFAPRGITISARHEATAEYAFTTNTEGRFTVEIQPPDALAADNYASVALPASGRLRVAVYTNRPEELRPLFAANPAVDAKFFPPEQYTPRPAADIMLLDRVAVSKQPEIPSLWIEPPREGAPLPIVSVVSGAAITSWGTDQLLSEGLRERETRIPAAEVFETFDGDLPVATVASGPTVVASPAHGTQPKRAVIGFDLVSGELRFQVTTPLLFGNLLRWLEPERFRSVDFSAGQVGAATVMLSRSESGDRIRVTGDDGEPVPFTLRHETLQLFVAQPMLVRVASNGRERTLSLTLPDVAEFEWTPPAYAATGLPRPSSFTARSADLWQALAATAVLLLLVEWTLFGSRRVLNRRAAARRTTAPTRRERELVTK